jgi:putative tricarboxylic transport membrane protein
VKRLHSDTLIAIVLLLICGVMFWDTFGFRTPPFATVSPRAWPRFVLVLLIGLCALYLVQSLRAPRLRAPRAPGAEGGVRGWLSANRNVLWCYGLFLAFLLTLPYLGMLVDGILFVYAAEVAIGKRDLRSHIMHLVIALVSVGLMWALFNFALDVMLPTGSLFGGAI